MNYNRRNFLANALSLSLIPLLSSCVQQKSKPTKTNLPKIEKQPFYLPISDNAQMSLRQKLNAEGFALGAKTYLRIFKDEKILEVWILQPDLRYRLYRRFPICTFSGQLGPKTKEGDKQAPEGFYSISDNQLNPHSNYHLAMNIAYPNEYDKSHGYTGSMIMIHGDCVSSGCYAMDDKQIEDIYSIVSASLQRGQLAVPVHIFPFKMTDIAMKTRATGKWADFWHQLAPAYTYFEKERIPPRIAVINKRYQVLPHFKD